MTTRTNGKYNFPAGVKIRGSGTYSDNVQDLQNASLDDIWANWEGATGSWLNYYRPAIDHNASIGGNAMKIQGSLGGIYRGRFTQQQLNERWVQLIRYAAKMETRILCNPFLQNFENGGAGAYAPSPLVPIATALTYIAALVNYFQANAPDVWPWIMSIDCCNESSSDVCSGSVGNASKFYDAVINTGAVPSYVPVCVSYPSVTFDTTFFGAGKVCEAREDVMDVHQYGGNYPTSSTYGSSMGTYYPGYELVIGEFQSNAQDSGTPTLHQNMLTFCLDPTIPQARGFLAWTIKDGNHNGLFWGNVTGTIYDSVKVDGAWIYPARYSPLTTELSFSVAGATLLPPVGLRTSNESKATVWRVTDCSNAYNYTNLYRISGTGAKTQVNPATSIPAIYDDSTNWTKKQYGYRASVVGGAVESPLSPLYVPTRLPRRMTRRRIQPALH